MKSIVGMFIVVLVIGLVFGGMAIAQSTSKTDANIELARKSEEEFWSKGNLAVADEIFSNEFIRHSAEMPDMKGREAYKQFMLGFREAFPDWKSTIENIFASGDLVAVKLTATGTMTGTLRGGPSGPPLPPTGKRLEFPVVDIYRIAEGKIVELWCYYYDVARILVVLGVLPPPPAPAAATKPSFITLTPGQYVHGWPAFTVSYPKEWVEQRSVSGEVFRVADPDSKTFPRVPNFTINVFLVPFPIDNWSNVLLPGLRTIARDIKIVYDKPSQLKDGTPAREAEIEWVRNDGLEMNLLLLITNKEATWITIITGAEKGKMGEDMKNYFYSLTFQPGREEPVNVPPDVRELLDKYCSDVLSGDVDRIMTYYSDQFSHSGMNKALVEQWFRNDPTAPTKAGLTSMEATVTVFEPQGDKAYMDGFYLVKGKNAPNGVKAPMLSMQFIKENGKWKFYGNHK